LPTRDPKDEFDHKGTKDTRKTELEFPPTTGSKQPTEKYSGEKDSFFLYPFFFVFLVSWW